MKPRSHWRGSPLALLIGLALFGLAFAACGDGTAETQAGDGSSTNSDSVAASDVAALGGWILQSGSLDGEALVPISGYDATLELDADGSFGGTAACNGYGGTADISGGGFAVSDYSSTEMACEPAPMALESLFLAALGKASNHEVVDGALRIFGDDVELLFVAAAPVSQTELVGTEWVMDTLIDGQTATTVRGRPTLLLQDDGSFTGSTGCRPLSGTWQLNDLGLQFPIMGAEGECEPDLTDQDNFVVSALEGTMTVEIDGPRLTLTSSGEQGLGYRSDLE